MLVVLMSVLLGAAPAVPAASDSEALSTSSLVEAPPPEPSPAVGDVPARTRALRIVVTEPVVEEVPERVGRLFANALVSELRKLDGLAVTSMEEVRAMMALEASRELAGCTDSSCLSDIADALGSDELVAVRLGRIGGEHQVSIRAIAAGGTSRDVTRRIAAGNGEEFFAIVHELVDALYPDRETRPNVERGVDRELARRISPPPLSPWLFWTGAGVATAGVVTGLGAGGLMAVLVDGNQRQVAASVDDEIQGSTLMLNQRRAEVSALVANIGYGVGAVAGVATGVIFFATDFEDLAHAE